MKFINIKTFITCVSLVAFAVIGAGCTTVQGRGGEYLIVTPAQKAAELQVQANIAKRVADLPTQIECGHTPGWKKHPSCPPESKKAQSAPVQTAQNNAPTQLGAPVSPNLAPNLPQSAAETYGGKSVLTVDIEEAFNLQGFANGIHADELDNELTDLVYYKEAISLEVKTLFERSLKKILSQRNGDKTPYDTWRRNPNRVNTLSLVVTNYKQKGWREEIWVNDYKTIARCEVTGIESRYSYRRVVAKCASR